jgi:glycyl-tRNA synthetase beta subunit
VVGVMGKHYAQREGLQPKLCDAIFEAALPRFAGDLLPTSPAVEPCGYCAPRD